MEEMVNNTLCQFESAKKHNESTQKFYNFLVEANKPLFEGPTIRPKKFK